MKEYITDSIFIKNKNKDFKFFPLEIFKWRIIEKNDELEYHKIGKFNENSKITALVSPSNYRLLYDILLIDKDFSLYEPEYNKDNFYLKKNIDKNQIINEFHKYMKRSYLSYLNYSTLKNIGLKRVEQFMIILSAISFKNIFVQDNAFFKEEFIVKKIVWDKNKIYKKDVHLDLIRFIYVIHRKLNYTFLEVFSYILKLYSNLKCSDPFSDEGIVFFEDDNELYNIYKEIIEEEVYYNRVLLESEKGEKAIINKPIMEYDDILTNYYLLQNEEYFEGKIIQYEESKYLLLEQIKYLKNIIPLKDILLSIQLLEKMQKINIKNFKIEVPLNLIKRINISKNKNWLSFDLWITIYNKHDLMFHEIVEPIDIEKLTFTCPLCDNNVYSITPEKLFCSNKSCKFTFHRGNLKNMGIKRISIENIIEGLKNDVILTEKDNGGNIPLFLKRNDNFFSFWIN